METLESKVEAILERNKRVEADKAWEISSFRRGAILVLTYITATIFLRVIGDSQFLFNAIIPTGGYLLSTLSFPYLKIWWVKNFFLRKR